MTTTTTTMRPSIVGDPPIRSQHLQAGRPTEDHGMMTDGFRTLATYPMT